jgi:hypothetical protein
MKRSTLSFHTSFLSHCLNHGITLIVSVILQTTGHANLISEQTQVNKGVVGFVLKVLLEVVSSLT